jgi:sarcosine oxidase subunit gamma
VEPLSAVSVTVWPGQSSSLAEAMQKTFGLDLPAPGRWTEAGAIAAVWLGPDHFSIQRQGAEALFPQIESIIADHAALIDLTDARAMLRLTGPESRNILAALLPIDLHPRAFAPGHAATTVGAHLTIQMRQLDDAPTYDLAVSRSFAGSLWRALELAGAGRLRLG